MFAAEETISGVLRDEWAGAVNGPELVRYIPRLVIAALLGGVLGFERGRAGKAAGPRTHMLVTLAAALFVVAPAAAGFSSDELSRVMQGVIAGMGFLGGGAIIKYSAEKDVRGLTTAADLWTATAIGLAAGLGRHALAIAGTLLAFFILDTLRSAEQKLSATASSEQDN